MTLKVSWIGEGQPKSGVTEYGHGTDHPQIPQGVLSQKNKADSNWNFDSSDLSEDEYLDKSVYIYMKDDKVKYNTDQNKIPADAEFKKGHFSDVYAMYKNAEPDAEFHKDDKQQVERQKLFAALQNKKIDVGRGRQAGQIELKESSDGLSLLNLYLFAEMIGSKTLKEKLSLFAQRKSKGEFISSYDLFEQNQGLADFYRDSSFGNVVETILRSDSRQDLKDYVWTSALPYMQQTAPSETPLAQTRSVEDKIEQTPVTDVEPIVPVRQSLPLLPGSPVSRQFSTENVSNGTQYLANMPITLLKESSTPYLQSIFGKPEDLAYTTSRFYAKNSKAEVKKLVDELATFATKTTDIAPELLISNQSGQNSSIFTTNFAYLNETAGVSTAIFDSFTQAFRQSLNTIVSVNPTTKSDTDLLEALQSTDAHTGVISLDNFGTARLAKMALEKIDLEPEFIDSINFIAQKSGKPPEEIAQKVKKQILDNLNMIKHIKARLDEGTNKANMGGVRGAGTVLGMLSSSFFNGLKNLGNEETNTLVGLSAEDFPIFAEALFGSTVSTISGDWVAYTDAENTLKTVSLGRLQYMTQALPFYVENEKLFIIDENQNKLFSSLQPVEKEELRQKLLKNAQIYTFEGLSTDAFLSNYLIKYQSAIYSKLPKDSAVLGAKKNISVLDSTSDPHLKDGYSDTRVQTLSSIANYFISEAQDIMMKPHSEGRARTVDTLLTMKELGMEDYKSQLLDAMGILPQHRETMWEATRDAMRITRLDIGTALSKNTTTLMAGAFAEALGMLMPLANILSNPEYAKVEIEKGDMGYFHTNMSLEEIAGKGNGKISEKKFLAKENTFKSIKITNNGNKEYIIKENREAGYGDVLHVRYRNNNNEMHVNTFELKLSKKKNQSSNGGQISPWLRSVLQTGRNTSAIKIGKSRDINLVYGMGKDDKADSFLKNKELASQVAYKSKRLGIPAKVVAKTSDAKHEVDLDSVQQNFSTRDGPGFRSF